MIHKFKLIVVLVSLVLIYPLIVDGQQKINLYRNRVHTFSIVFPNGWIQREGQTPHTVVVSEDSEKASIVVQVFQTPAEVSLDDVADGDLQGLITGSFAEIKAKSFPDAVLIKSGTTYIANKKAIWMLLTYSIKQPFHTEKVRSMYYIVLRGQKMYQFICTSSENQYAKYNTIFLDAIRSVVFEDASWYK